MLSKDLKISISRSTGVLFLLPLGAVTTACGEQQIQDTRTVPSFAEPEGITTTSESNHTPERKGSAAAVSSASASTDRNSNNGIEKKGVSIDTLKDESDQQLGSVDDGPSKRTQKAPDYWEPSEISMIVYENCEPCHGKFSIKENFDATRKKSLSEVRRGSMPLYISNFAQSEEGLKLIDYLEALPEK